MKAFIEASLITLAAVFAPVKGMMIVTGVMIISDLVFGIIASYKRKEPITSAGLRRTIVKMFVYQSAIALGFLGEKYLTDAVPVTKIIGGIILMTEGLSVMENLNSISGNDLLKVLIEKLGSANGAAKEKKDES